MGYSQTRNNSKLKGHNKTRSFGVGVTLGAAILAASSFLSYAFGLLRDRLLAGQFGASMELDVYQASFLIPDLILNIFLAGALASAIVPVLSGYFAKGKNEEAFRIISFMINVVLAVIFVIAALCFAFMPFLVQITAPGFVGEKRELLIEVTRVILLSPLIFGLSNLLGGALVSLKKFLAYSLSPVLYNLGIVIGIIFLADQYGVVGVALSTIIGAFLHLSIRLISILRVGFRYHFIFKPIPKGAYKVFALMLPRIFGLLAWQGNLWAFTFFGSTLAEGSVGVFNLARNFQSLPVSLIGISLATAVFPFLASDFSLKKNQEFSKNFETTFRRILFFVMPAAAFMALLSKRIISLFLGTGKFDEQAILLTAGVLMIFSLAIPFESLNHLLNRTFYARKNTHLPVAISLGAMAINISACYFLIKFMAVRGLSLAFLLAVIFQSLLLLLFTKIKVKGINFKRITIDAAKILTMTIVMGLAMSLVLKFFPTHDRITSQLIGLLAVGLIGGFSYLILAYLMKVNELDFLITKARRWLANRD